MQAWQHKKGKKRPELAAWPEPDVGESDVLVEVQATAIHPVDIETSEGGNAMMLPMSRPFVGGVDFVGVVLEVGRCVTDLEPGTTVFGYRGVPVQGAWAERIAVPRSDLSRAPEAELATLATLPLPALCALQALDETGAGPGDTVLVHGGAGGVGSVAVQVFAARGLEVVATASSKDADWVHGLGAREVIDYRATRFEETVKDIDLVFDTVGGKTLQRSNAVVRRGGAVVSLSALPPVEALRLAGMAVPLPLRLVLPLATWWSGRAARSAGVRFAGQVTVPSGSRLEQLLEISRHRPLRTRIDRTFDWSQLATAVDHVASGTARGRVVITRT